MAVIRLIFLAIVLMLKGAGLATFWLLRSLFRVCRRGLMAAFRRRSVTHGSARWATFLETWRGGAFGGNGIILAKRFGRYIRLNRPGYALVVAKTRAGKGTGIIVPSILSAKGSVIVTDVKAENYDTTQRHRRRLGPVFRLDVIDPEESDCWNPLGMVRVGSIHEPDDALALANLLIVEDANAAKHWDYKAQELLAALIIYVLRRYPDRPELQTLAKVKSLLALGVDGLAEALEDADTLGSTTLRNVASALRGSGGTDEVHSIVSNADKALVLFEADRPGGMVTRGTDFSMNVFKQSVASLYIIVEEDKLSVYGTFLRVVIGSALMAQTRNKADVPADKPLFIIDEAAAVGRIPELETGAGYLAAYARLLFIFQDMNQIERTYAKGKSVIANAGAFVAFGVRELDTAKRLSEMIGRTTEISHSQGVSQANTALLQHQASTGRSETGRPLMDPSEILRMDERELLLWIDGVRHPMKVRKIQFFREWRYANMWDYWRGDKKRGRRTIYRFRTDP